MSENKDSQVQTIKAMIDEIFFEYCKVALGNKLFEELNSLKNVSTLDELLDAFSLVESNMHQRKELLNLLYAAKDVNLNSSDACIIEMKAKLFDMLMSIRECNKVSLLSKESVVDQLKEENTKLKMQLAKAECDLDQVKKSYDLIKNQNKELTEQIADLRLTLQRVKSYPTYLEDFMRFSPTCNSL